MKPLFTPLLLLLIGIFPPLQSILAQPFLEVFLAIDHEPDSITSYNGIADYVSLHQDWAVINTTNPYDLNGTDWKLIAGAAYIYLRDAKGSWEFYQKIIASDRTELNIFSHSLDIQGERILLGSFGDDKDAGGLGFLENAGSAYVFELNQLGAWVQTQKVIAPDRQEDDRLGQYLALGENHFLLGQPDRPFDTGTTIFDQVGQVYVFAQDSAGAWVPTQTLRPAQHLSGFEKFGTALAIDGNFAAVGVHLEDEDADGMNPLTDAGAVYLYHLDSMGVWQFYQQVVASDREAFDWFGYAVSLADSQLLVSAIWEEEDVQGQNPSTGTGSAYVFNLNQQGIWQETQKLVPPLRKTQQHFGWTVSISGNVAAMGYKFSETAQEAGKVSLFQKTGNQWQWLQTFTASDGEANDKFGQSLSLDASTLLVGAPRKIHSITPTNFEYGGFYILERCELNDSIVHDTICPGWYYLLGGQYLDSPGQYYHSWEKPDGCDTTIILELALATPNVAVAESDSALHSMAVNASYQWLDCGNGDLPIPGATNQQFIPSSSGQYAVVVSQYSFGCTDTSACVAFIAAGKSTEWESQLQLFPNPSRGSVQLVFDQPQRELSVRLFDLSGKLLQSQSYSQAQHISLTLPQSTGLYLLEIQSKEGGTIVKKVEKW